MLEAEGSGLWPWSRERSFGKLDMDQGQGPSWRLWQECPWSGQRMRGLRAPTGWPASWAEDLCGHTDPTPRRIRVHFNALLLPSSNS